MVALTLLAAAIRFHDLGGESLWHNEGMTFQRASLPPSELAEASVRAGHTPTYFLLMHAWLAVGDSEFVLRAPSAIFGLLTIPLCYALGHLLAGRRVAVIASLLFAVSAFQVHYAQEARSYALLTLCVAVAMLAIVWIARDPERALLPPGAWRGADPGAAVAWIGFALGTLAALLVHNMAVFFLLSAEVAFALLALSLRSRWRKLLPNWLFAHAIILAGWVWWWPFLFRQGARIIDSFWMPEPTGAMVVAVLRSLYLDGWYGTLSISLPLWALVGAWALRRRPWLLAALVALLVTAPLGILAFALVRPLFSAKQFLWTAIPFFLLAACGIAAIRPKVLFLAALAALLVEGAVKLDRYFAAQTRTDWRRLVTTVAEAAPPDSLLVVSPDGNLHVVGYYLQRLGVPPAKVALLGLPPGADGAPLAEAVRSGRPLWLLLNPTTQPGVAAAAERSAMLSELARADAIRLYRLDPRDQPLP
jgi:4-amino-4-deoxy-L-arabinose transferase-like glycosyltransferase